MYSLIDAIPRISRLFLTCRSPAISSCAALRFAIISTRLIVCVAATMSSRREEAFLLISPVYLSANASPLLIAIFFHLRSLSGALRARTIDGEAYARAGEFRVKRCTIYSYRSIARLSWKIVRKRINDWRALSYFIIRSPATRVRSD